MHRFRKKSDASTKRGQIGAGIVGLGFDLPDIKPVHLNPVANPVVHESLPELPPASNFRTSLILPDLTRRFTLLRTPSGQPLSIEELRNRFADQRARGAENQISEEEEDMVLEALGRIRGSENGNRHANGNVNARNGDARQGHDDTGDEDDSSTSREVAPADSDYRGSYQRSSVRSTNTVASSFAPTTSSVRSSPSSRSAKRYSNNLFSSGRMRDYNYNRSQRSGASQRSALSITSTESSVKGNSMYLDRPVTPDRDDSSSSAQSSPMTDKTPVIRSAPLNPPGPYIEHPSSAAEHRPPKNLNPAALKRASLALEEALKEIEEEMGEEAEDEIVMPRSAPASRTRYSQQSHLSGDSIEASTDGLQRSGDAGTAISSDKHDAEAEIEPASPVPLYSGRPGTISPSSPSPRLPGYIPGMPRPMTPRDPSFDSDDQSRPHSTTPRPISPLLPGLNGRSSPLIPASIAAGLMRRDSNASTTYSPQSPNGTFSFEDQRGSADLTLEDALSSSILGRRRPASPLAGPVYQPMAVSSRPGTPSNVTWNTSTTSFSSNAPKTHGRNESADSGRSRSGSLSIDDGPVADRSKPTAGRSLRSQTDSPMVDRGQPTLASAFGWDSEPSMNRTPAVIPSPELGTPMVMTNRTVHSPTPTQGRSPPALSATNDLASNVTGRRTSRQNAPSSPFNLGSAHQLSFSPRPISSRSSVASAGSSYHSDDGSHKRDRDFDLFNDRDTQNSPWHEVSSTDKTSAATHDDSQDSSEAEDVLNRYAGLTKSDFVAIQEKLVGAAVAKAATPDPRERAPSLRRRRPSTSQSNYSLNGRENKVISPAPQTQTQAQAQTQNHTSATSPSASADNAAKGQDSINNVRTSPIQPSKKEEPSISRQQRDLSPTSRRNRDLAQALFGAHSNNMSPAPTQPAPSPSQKSPGTAYQQPSPSTASHIRSTTEEPASVKSPTSQYPMQMTRNPSILRSPKTPANQAELAREVQRKTEAATASLKRGPSTKYNDTNVSSLSLSRKRITPHQISSPHLVSASTSMDTIPLRSPSVASGNTQPQKPAAKLGQRIRRWGTLRAKPTMPTGEEVTPFPLDAQSPRSPPVQTVHYTPSNMSIPQPPASASLAEFGGSKAPLPSPPATAGPGLKSFMSRFRKPRAADMSPERDRRSVEQERRPRPPISTPSSDASTSPLNDYTFPQQDQTNQSQSAPAGKPSFQSPASSNVIPLDPLPSAPPAKWSGLPKAHPPQQPEQPETSANDTRALKQLFDAASNLGLDQTALNDLLARSGSTSSRSTAGWTMLTRNNSAAANSRPATRNESAMDRARSPTIPEDHPSTDLERSEDTVIVPRKRVKPPQAYPDGQDGDAGSNAVVRRTIIFPSESRTSTIDLNILMRKNSSSTRRNRAGSVASAASSSRSVHDRAPTPPPPRSASGRRFSHDASPPVPQLPASFSAQAESLLPLATPRPTAASPIEKSSSAYDSLYEMYAGERATSGLSDGEASLADVQSRPELGRGVEVIEMANGETIWSIVNGLRDEDVESIYASRNSFASSDNSTQPADGVQVFFKEHGRAGSKGSNSSFLSRKKLPPGHTRPETKVFYSSSNQIGRLIENLSEGREAGSFNFMPTKAHGHSHSSSFNSEADMHWTVEERLEHMLGSMGNP